MQTDGSKLIDPKWLASAERVDINWQNSSMRVRFQDGRDILITDVRVHRKDLDRWLKKEQKRRARAAKGLP